MLSGPAGTGKTTLAKLLINELDIDVHACEADAHAWPLGSAYYFFAYAPSAQLPELEFLLGFHCVRTTVLAVVSNDY